MKEGDLIIYRKPAPWGKRAEFGIVIEFNSSSNKGLCSDTDWALILWGDDTMTWEDADCNLEDKTFEVVDENWRPC